MTDTERDFDRLAERFRRDGYVHLPGVVDPRELAALQAATAAMIDGGWQGKEPESDYFHDALPDTGADVFHRLQYIFPKDEGECLALVAHPVVLALVERILGPDYICAAEALVFKAPGNGREVPVHADCDPVEPGLAPVIFNVDIYLDDSTVENGCLWVAPGSHDPLLSAREISAKGFDFPGLMPVPVRAGDIIFHNIRLVHGSHRSQSPALRRTLYYEFHSLPALVGQGGIRPAHPVPGTWIEDRLRLLPAAIDERKARGYQHADQQPNPPLPAGWEYVAGISRPINLRPALGYNKYF